MSDQLGVAIIGCGYWGVNYVRVFNELSGSKVAIVCDRSKRRLDQVHDLFPWVNSTTETNEIFESKDIDAVVVCSEASNHFDITWKALNHGKHVLVEKPITTKASEALELVTLSEARKLTLMVGHTFIYNPAVKKLKSLIDSSDLGSVYYLYARRTNLGPVRKDVNALWDLAPHDVSIFSYLLDEMPSWVSAVGMRVLRNGREDVGFITLGYASGVVANIHVSWADPSKVRELVAVGSEKRVVFNDLDPSEKVRIFEKGISTVEKGPDSTYGEQSLQSEMGTSSVHTLTPVNR